MFTSGFTTHPTIRALVKGDGAAEAEELVIETRPLASLNSLSGAAVPERS